MMLLRDFREPAQPFCSDRRSNYDRNRGAVSRFLADSSPRLAHSTAHRKIAGRASCHSPIRISYGIPQCKAVDGIGWVEAHGGRGRAEVVSAIGIVSVPLYLLRWNGNVLPVLSALRVKLAIDILDFSRVAVRLIATANGRIVGHVPC